MRETEDDMRKMYQGSILENHYMIDIPTETEDLALLIYHNSYDWAVCLDWIDTVAKKRGIIIKTLEVAERIRQLIGEE